MCCHIRVVAEHFQCNCGSSSSQSSYIYIGLSILILSSFFFNWNDSIVCNIFARKGNSWKNFAIKYIGEGKSNSLIFVVLICTIFIYRSTTSEILSLIFGAILFLILQQVFLWILFSMSTPHPEH